MPAPGAPSLARIRDHLASWYRRGHRDLPWRRTRDPYAIWISEVMLQQTRVDTVIPRYTRWLARFPTVEALARASLDEVLEEWAGLGYYARARNLHAAARAVSERHGGHLPDDPAAIRALPGIGRYTAGAILSLAWHRREPILDGNVLRVLSRLFRLAGDPRAAAGQKALWTLAERMVEAGDPATINQAMMELGATVCAPRDPSCASCPLSRVCAAHQAGDTGAFPAPSRATKVIAIDQVTVAIIRRGRMLLARRPPRGMWGGLLEPPTGAPREGEPLPDAARRIARERAGLAITDVTPLVRFQHLLSHRRITFHCFHAEAPRGRVRLEGYDAFSWIEPDAAGGLGISRATARMIEALIRIRAPKSTSPPG